MTSNDHELLQNGIMTEIEDFNVQLVSWKSIIRSELELESIMNRAQLQARLVSKPEVLEQSAINRKVMKPMLGKNKKKQVREIYLQYMIIPKFKLDSYAPLGYFKTTIETFSFFLDKIFKSWNYFLLWCHLECQGFFSLLKKYAHKIWSKWWGKVQTLMDTN